MSHAEKDDFISKLLDRLDALESKVNNDSHNSGKPPSSDGFSKKKKTRSLRGASDKKVGGQVGHKGTTLKASATPTRTVRLPLPTHCMHCHDRLAPDDAHVAQRRQVIDIPAAAPDVVEYQALQQTCRCGRVHTSAFPDGVAETVQYGCNVRVLGVLLTQGQLLPYARAAQLIADLYGVKVSPATLVTWVAEASATLQGTANLIADHLRAAPLVHADESGLRVAGGLHWLHIAANVTHTWYGVHPKRGMDAVTAQDILPKRLGVLVHDCWAPYWKLDCVHALCNAHLLRELVYIEELTGRLGHSR